LVPQNPESMPQDSLTHAQLGIPDSTPPESALSDEQRDTGGNQLDEFIYHEARRDKRRPAGGGNVVAC
jgi:hypothetical protein